MKKIILILVFFTSFYMAGMYQYTPLMVFCLIQIVLILVLFVLAIHFLRTLTIHMEKEKEYVEKGQEVTCHVIAVNTGRIPMNRFLAKLHIGYQGFEKEYENHRIYGSCDNGETTLSITLTKSNGGIGIIGIERARVYDYL